MRDTQVDQASLFPTRDYLDRIPQHLFGPGHKLLSIAGDPESVRADNLHGLRRHAAEPLCEAAQTFQCALLGLLGQVVIAIQTRAKLDFFAHFFERPDFAMDQPRYHHVEAV